jgi:hypothetical protein
MLFVIPEQDAGCGCFTRQQHKMHEKLAKSRTSEDSSVSTSCSEFLKQFVVLSPMCLIARVQA